MGIVQMQRLDEILSARQRVAHAYIRQFMDHPHIVLPTIPSEASMSWFVFVVRALRSV